MTITEIERLLDAGKLQVQMVNGAWWDIRRTGITQRWKRDPERFRIPYKMGLRSYGAIDTTDLGAIGIRVKPE